MNRDRLRSKGFSLIELLIVIAIILIIATIALPKLNRARMYAMETAAIAHIRTIHTAQTQYYSTYGKFAGSMVELGPPASGAPTAAASDLIPNDLAQGEKGGYKFVMVGTPAGYTINANPTAFGNTGSRTFFSDQTLVIRQNDGQEPANDKSKELR